MARTYRRLERTEHEKKFFSHPSDVWPDGEGSDQGLRLEVVPGRGLLPGSISHPWLTRRRSASMRCSPQSPARNAHRPVTGAASFEAEQQCIEALKGKLE